MPVLAWDRAENRLAEAGVEQVEDRTFFGTTEDRLEAEFAQQLAAISVINQPVCAVIAGTGNS